MRRSGSAGTLRRLRRGWAAKGRLICFDRDPEAMELAKARLDEVRAELGSEMPEVMFEPRAFSEAGESDRAGKPGRIARGLWSEQPAAGRGAQRIQFSVGGPLDMRMDTRSGETAEQVVNQEDENELADLIYEFGEERRSRRIARAIVRARPISTTAELAQVISAAAPSMKGDKIHPATRTFQALRIRVNNELGEIRSLLKSAGSLLKPGGRLVLISFHSLEDRLVKDAFREAGRERCLRF